MGNKIQFKRGLKDQIPTLNYGEPGFVSDEKELYIGTESGNIKLTSKSEINQINEQLEHIESNKKYLTPEDFGAISDGLTDDYNALQNCINECVKQGLMMLLKNKYYTSKTLDFSNIKGIKGLGHQLIDKWDNRFYNGEMIGEKWFLDNDLPYSLFIEGCKGSVIFSDIANPIVKYPEGNHALFADFAICGSFKNIEQIGFADLENPSIYNGMTFNTKNFKITHCGSHGMMLKRGMEYFVWENSSLSNNGGYGLYIDRSFTDNPCEYSEFNSCVFENNYLDGVYLKGMRRGIQFNFCNLSRNGQYQLKSSINRKRNCPSDHVNLKTGIRVATINQYDCSCFSAFGCFGEETQSLFYLDIITNAINNVNIEQCQMQCLQRSDSDLTLPSALVIAKGNYIGNLNIINNMIRKDASYALYNCGVTYGEKWEISGYGDRVNSIPFNMSLKTFKNVKIESCNVDTINVNNMFWEIKSQTTTEETIKTYIPKLYIGDYTVSQLKGYKFAFFYIGYNHCATNGQGNVGDLFGITKGNDNKYEIVKLTNNLNSLNINPTTGEISFICPAWKSVSLQKIDLQSF